MISSDTDAWIAAVSRTVARRIVKEEEMQHEEEQANNTIEIVIGDRKIATFYREAGELLLENEESAFYLDREETYRLLALLHAEVPAPSNVVE